MLSQKQRKKAASRCKAQTTWVRTLSVSREEETLSKICGVLGEGVRRPSLTHRLAEETPDLQLLKGQLGIEIVSSTVSSPRSPSSSAGKDLLLGAM